MMAILTITVVLICMFLVIRDVENLFMCLLAIHMSSFSGVCVCVCVCVCALSMATPTAYGSSQGLNRSCSCWPVSQPQQRWDQSPICNLYHSSRQCQILNPLSRARD